MTFDNKLQRIHTLLAREGLDGWLLYDFRRSNDLACQFLEIPTERMLTRRFFYWIPVDGPPVKIVSRIELHALDHLPGATRAYATWQELETRLAEILLGNHRIAMEFSPRNAVPYVSKVDGGTIDLVRSYGIDVASSGDLLQEFTSVWDQQKLELHLEAALVLEEAVSSAWHFISESLARQRTLNEYDVQQFILNHFKAHDCFTESPPICAVNAHSADPHYLVPKEGSAEIKADDFILLDLWCKTNHPRGTYADITRVGVASGTASIRQQQVFEVVKRAQQAAFDFVTARYMAGVPMMGWEVDQVCRQVIIDAGYGPYFIHRTGHNIDEEDHGNGAHLDNLETQDRRRLIPGTCFSIEPGIYLPDEFGVRLEYDVYLTPGGLPRITTGAQFNIVTLG